MEYRTRKMVMDRDLNPAGSLFGGRALEWIDEEAAIYAYCQLKYPTHLVTKLMSTIDFKAPAFKGDIIEIGMNTVKIGTTSITIEASIRNKRTQQEIVRVEKIVFVNLGEDHKPQSHNVYYIDPNTIITTQSDVWLKSETKIGHNGIPYTLTTNTLVKESDHDDRW